MKELIVEALQMLALELLLLLVLHKAASNVVDLPVGVESRYKHNEVAFNNILFLSHR